jgi:hypothetical protein
LALETINGAAGRNPVNGNLRPQIAEPGSLIFDL